MQKHILYFFSSEYFVKSYSSEATDIVLVIDGSSNLMNDDSEKVKDAAKMVIKTLNSEDRVKHNTTYIIPYSLMYTLQLNTYS